MANLLSFPTHEKVVGTLLSMGFTPMEVKVSETKKQYKLIGFCVFEKAGKLISYQIYTKQDFDYLNSVLTTHTLDGDIIRRDIIISSTNGVNINIKENINGNLVNWANPNHAAPIDVSALQTAVERYQ